jgi:hypothetical protein
MQNKSAYFTELTDAFSSVNAQKSEIYNQEFSEYDKAISLYNDKHICRLKYFDINKTIKCRNSGRLLL